MLSLLACQFPVFFGVTIYQVHSRMGVAVWALVGGVVLFFLMMMYQAVKIGKFREQIAPSTDKRCKATEELVGAINIVKMYCWESSFLEKIIKNRKLEMALIKKRNYLGHIFHRLLGGSGRTICICVYRINLAMVFLSIN